MICDDVGQRTLLGVLRLRRMFLTMVVSLAPSEMEYPVAHDSEVVAYRDESRILELEQLRLTYNR